MAVAQGLRALYLRQDGPPGFASLRPGYTVTDTTATVAPMPDIQWLPILATYRERVNRLAAETNRPKVAKLPDGFPARVEGSRVWKGQDLDTSDYVVNLSDAEIQEIKRALKTFISNFPDTSPDDVNADSFSLPILRGKLEALSEEVHSGKGIVILRGLDHSEFSRTENILLYAGICRHVGEQFGIQDADGNYLIHIKDIGKQVPKSENRQAPFANTAQPFHCDSGDILAMYALGQSRKGGASCFASTGQIYNEIAQVRPDVIHTLADKDWIMDKRNSRGAASYWYQRPLLFNFPHHGPALYFNRRVLTGSAIAPRTPGVPPMSEVQAEALDMVHFTAVKNQLKLRLQPGDIIFVNNFSVVHARDAYEDDDDNDGAEQSAETKGTPAVRHMLRLWLRNEARAWKTPEEVAASWMDTYGDSPRRAKAKWDFEVPLIRGRMFDRANSCS